MIRKINLDQNTEISKKIRVTYKHEVTEKGKKLSGVEVRVDRDEAEDEVLIATSNVSESKNKSKKFIREIAIERLARVLAFVNGHFNNTKRIDNMFERGIVRVEAKSTFVKK